MHAHFKAIILTFVLAGGLSACVASTAPTYLPESGDDDTTYSNSWSDRPDLVTSTGEVKVRENETVTNHPSTDPDDSGFAGDGPPSIDG